MPCLSHWPEPTKEQLERHRAAKLLTYVLKKTNAKVPDWLEKESDNDFANDPRSVTTLCELLTTMDPEQRDNIVYDARNKTARALADWWENHLVADAERERRESKAAEQQTLVQRALDKLTPDERKALGFK